MYHNDSYVLRELVILSNNFNIYKPFDESLQSVSHYFSSFALHNSIEHKSFIVNEQLVRYMIVLTDGRICTCSDDHTISVIDIENDKIDMTIEGHTKPVYSLCQLENGKVLSGSVDKSIKIWEVGKDRYKCESTIETEGEVREIVRISNNRIAFSHKNPYIYIWDMRTNFDKKNIKELKGHKGSRMETMIYMKEKDYLIAGYNNKIVTIWCMKTYQSVFSIKGIALNIGKVLCDLDEETFAIGGYDCIAIINVKKGEITQQAKINVINANITSMIKLRDNKRILCGCRTGNFLVFDYQNNTMNLISTSNNGWIEGLHNINKETFITCSSNYLKIWKY